MFAFSNSGYSNCQVTRVNYDHLARYDMVKDSKWDVYELQRRGSGDDGGSVYFPSDSESKNFMFFQ